MGICFKLGSHAKCYEKWEHLIINTFQGCFQRSSCDESDGMTTYGHLKWKTTNVPKRFDTTPTFQASTTTNFHNMWVFMDVTNKS